MITPPAGADLTVTEAQLRELAREYHTDAGARHIHIANNGAVACEMGLFSVLMFGVDILLEKIIISSDIDAVIQLGNFSDYDSGENFGQSRCLDLGQAATTLAYMCQRIGPPTISAWGNIYVAAERSLVLDFGGLIIPPSKGFGGKFPAIANISYITISRVLS